MESLGNEGQIFLMDGSGPYDQFIAYIMPKACQAYTVRCINNDNFYELDASGHFLHVPVVAGEHEPVTNDIKLNVQYSYHNEDFHATPFCIWRRSPYYREKYVGITVFKPTVRPTTDDADNEWLLSQGLSWLGAGEDTGTSEFKIDLQQVNTDDLTTLQLNDIPVQTSVKMSNKQFEYIPNSWFVCYHWPGHDHPRRNLHMSYRQDPYIHVNCSTSMSSSDRWQYLTIGKKTLPMSDVFFYRKINSVRDYLSCIDMMLGIQNATVY